MAFIGFDVYGTLVDPLGMDGPLREHVGLRAGVLVRHPDDDLMD